MTGEHVVLKVHDKYEELLSITFKEPLVLTRDEVDSLIALLNEFGNRDEANDLEFQARGFPYPGRVRA